MVKLYKHNGNTYALVGTYYLNEPEESVCDYCCFYSVSNGRCEAAEGMDCESEGTLYHFEETKYEKEV